MKIRSEIYASHVRVHKSTHAHVQVRISTIPIRVHVHTHEHIHTHMYIYIYIYPPAPCGLTAVKLIAVIQSLSTVSGQCPAVTVHCTAPLLSWFPARPEPRKYNKKQVAPNWLGAPNTTKTDTGASGGPESAEIVTPDGLDAHQEAPCRCVLTIEWLKNMEV